MTYLILPLEVAGLGIVISYAIAILMKLMLVCIRHFSSESRPKQAE